MKTSNVKVRIIRVKSSSSMAAKARWEMAF